MYYPPEISVAITYSSFCAHRGVSKRISFKTWAATLRLPSDKINIIFSLIFWRKNEKKQNIIKIGLFFSGFIDDKYSSVSL